MNGGRGTIVPGTILKSMSKFIYKAKKGPDEITEGVIEADSENVDRKSVV